MSKLSPSATILAWLLLAAALLIVPWTAFAQSPVRVMTFNVRLPLESDGANAWDERRALAAQMIRKVAPDVIGTQELHKEQGDYLVGQLPVYRWIGVDRRGGHEDEHMGLFYRADRFKLVDSGNFWLSETPQVPGSISWGHPYPRMVTWALLESRKDGRRFHVFNTHLPYRPEDVEARRRCAELLFEKIDAIAGTGPVVLTGDFNTTPDSPVHALLTTRLADAWDNTSRRKGPDKTFHNFSGKADRRIDWILTRGFTADRVQTVTYHKGALQTSDHFPVLAVLKWKAVKPQPR